MGIRWRVLTRVTATLRAGPPASDTSTRRTSSAASGGKAMRSRYETRPRKPAADAGLAGKASTAATPKSFRRDRTRLRLADFMRFSRQGPFTSKYGENEEP